MDKRDYRSQLMQRPEFAIEAAKGDFIMDVTESICAILEQKNMDRKDLARNMNKSKGYISQLLNGDRNMTLATLTEICHALGCKPSIKFKKHEDHVVFEDSFKVDSPVEPEPDYPEDEIKCNFEFKKVS